MVVGTTVVGSIIVSCTIVGCIIVGSTVVGCIIVGSTLVGSIIIGISVVGTPRAAVHINFLFLLAEPLYCFSDCPIVACRGTGK